MKPHKVRGREMLRNSVLASVALVLAGCLSTAEPVLDASNSRPVGDIPEFIAYVDAWEGFVGKKDSPRALITDGGRAIVVDDIIVVQENAEYFALAMMGGRPVSCVIYTEDIIQAVAEAQGVTVELDIEDGKGINDAPVPVRADGSTEALVAFIRDQFANQRLACVAARRGGG
jgi:hypothetical protein